MWQRPLDAFNALNPGDRQQVQTMLAKVGGEEAFSPQPMVRVERENFKLMLAR